MVDPHLVRRRLVAQGLIGRPYASPHAAVSAHGAMQGQDLPGVMASIALRCACDNGDAPHGASEDHVRSGIARVAKAFDDGLIVRGYPMRGTVFVVAAEDLRWMTELCAGGPLRAQVARRAALGLGDELVARARAILEEAGVASPRGISRADLFARWESAGLAPAGGRGYHLLSHLIASGIAAYGPFNGADNDVVLAETWLPVGTSIAERFGGDLDAATAELLRRYLTSHGPATVRDFAWWTKLPLARIRRALALIGDDVVQEQGADGEVRFSRPGLAEEVEALGSAVDATILLAPFDEIVLGYPDRMAIVDEAHHPALVPGNNGIFQRGILRRGTIVGTWRRGGRPGRRSLELTGFTPLPKVAVADAERLHAAFPYVTD